MRDRNSLEIPKNYKIPTPTPQVKSYSEILFLYNNTEHLVYAQKDEDKI